VETNFHLIENIEWHCMQLEWNSNSTELNSVHIWLNWNKIKFVVWNSNPIVLSWIPIQLNINEMQIGEQDIENMLIISII
jgi:hypothetical protein